MGSEEELLASPGCDRKSLNLDARFSAYSQVYTSLDQLLWGVPAILLGIIIISLGMLRNYASDASCQLPFLTHSSSVAVAHFALAVFSVAGWWWMRRIKLHREKAGAALARLDVADGYFYQRPGIRRWYTSASGQVQLIFLVLAVVSILVGIHSKMKGISMKDIPDDAIGQFGLYTKHNQQDNGELRFRLMHTDGNGYIRTIAADKSGWQNAHYHRAVLETYIVQHGQIVFAERVGDATTYKLLRENDFVTTKPVVAHNVYMFPGAVIHTVKHGHEADPGGSDRIPDDPLTDETHQLNTVDKVIGAAAKTSKAPG